MKVCFFNSTKAWGGGEKWHLDAALAFRNAGHSVTVVSNQNSELKKRTLENGINSKSFSISNLSFLNLIKVFSIHRYFRTQKFDVVILNLPKDLKIAAPVAKWARVKRVVYRRGSAIPIKNSCLNRLLFGKFLTDIIANSEATKRSILENNKELFPADKIHVFYNGINVQEFNQLESCENEIPVIGNLGRCVYQKGQDTLLQVAFILKRRNINCRFLIGGDGALLNKLKLQAQDLNVSDMVTFTGFVKNTPAFLQSIDIFALPSRWEGFGYVIAEAMACHKPVVAFNISSNPEIISDNETGYLVPFEDTEKFADALQKLIQSKEICHRFGENGLKNVTSNFDFDKNMQKIITFSNED